MFRQTCVALAIVCGAGAAHAGEVYGGVGLPGVMLGYAHAISPSVTLRGDFATLGSHDKDFEEEGIDYKGKIKMHRVGVFADWFVAGGFRLTGGVTFNNMRADLSAKGNGQNVTIGGQPVTLTAADRFDVTIKFPKTTPYLGIGYGHQMGTGLGFVFDLGVSIGKAKLSETHSGPNMGLVPQSNIDAEMAELRDGVGKIRAIPQLSIGVNYKF